MRGASRGRHRGAHRGAAADIPQALAEWAPQEVPATLADGVTGRAPASASPFPARILGLDVGSVRIGVALSDPTGAFAEPLAVLPRWPVRGRPTAAASLAAWAAEHKITQVVVGRPLRMSGEEGPAVATVEATVASLWRELDLEIIWWDERLSSREAERVMISCGVRRDKRRERIDMVAASLILQSYLDARRSPLGADPSPPLPDCGAPPGREP